MAHWFKALAICRNTHFIPISFSVHTYINQEHTKRQRRCILIHKNFRKQAKFHLSLNKGKGKQLPSQ